MFKWEFIVLAYIIESLVDANVVSACNSWNVGLMHLTLESVRPNHFSDSTMAFMFTRALV